MPRVGAGHLSRHLGLAGDGAIWPGEPGPRAAVSIPTNLAEGAAKRGPREFRRYLDISLGSLSELTYLLKLAHDLGYIRADEFEQIEQMRDRAGQVTWGLYRAISRQAR